MGSECSYCDGDPESMQQAAPNTALYKRGSVKQRERTGSLSSSSDSYYDEFNMDADESIIEPSVSYDDNDKQQIMNGFQQAIEQGNDSLVIYYVEEHPTLDLLDITFKNGDKCLHVAVRNKKYNLIVYLLSQGESPNQQNEQNGDTSLHTAVRIGDIKIVTILSRYDADANITNNKQETALSIAMDTDHEDIIELLSPETQKIFSMNLNTEILKGFSNDLDDLSESDNDLDELNGMSTIRINDITDDILSPKSVQTDDEKAENQQSPKMIHSPQSETLLNAPSSPMAPKSQINESSQIKRIAKTNPFSKLKRKNTKKVLHDITNLDVNKKELSVLEAWIEKKQSVPPYAWHKRWVVVKDSHLLWSDRKLVINNSKDKEERNKWNNYVNLMAIKDVSIVETSKGQRKFIVRVTLYGKDAKSRDYIWKAASKEDRDCWVKGLKQHIQYIKSMVLYLGKTDF